MSGNTCQICKGEISPLGAIYITDGDWNPILGLTYHKPNMNPLGDAECVLIRYTAICVQCADGVDNFVKALKLRGGSEK